MGKDQSMMASYNKGYNRSKSRLMRPQSAAGNYTAELSKSCADTSSRNRKDLTSDSSTERSVGLSSGLTTELTSGFSAFGSCNSMKTAQNAARRPHTAGVARPTRSVDSYIAGYTAVA